MLQIDPYIKPPADYEEKRASFWITGLITLAEQYLHSLSPVNQQHLVEHLQWYIKRYNQGMYNKNNLGQLRNDISFNKIDERGAGKTIQGKFGEFVVAIIYSILGYQVEFVFDQQGQVD